MRGHRKLSTHEERTSKGAFSVDNQDAELCNGIIADLLTGKKLKPYMSPAFQLMECFEHTDYRAKTGLRVDRSRPNGHVFSYAPYLLVFKRLKCMYCNKTPKSLLKGFK